MAVRKPFLRVFSCHMDYVVYILKSVTNPDKIYTGFTSDLILRIQQHNTSDYDKTAFTKKFRPLMVIYVAFFETKAEAMKREKWLKTGVGRDWIKNNISSW